MLPVFRKIRWRLAQDNNFIKYSRYAVGEIVLVVIGILIALQINNWNQEVKNKKEERFYLTKLKENINQDTLMLGIRLRSMENAMAELTTLTREIWQEPKDTLSNPQSMITLMATYRFYPERSTFDNLTATGKLELLSNQTIIDSIHVYYNFINNRAHTWNESIESYTRNSFGPYLMKKFSLQISDEIDDFAPSEIRSANAYELADDVFIYNAISYKYSALSQLEEVYRITLNRATNLNSLIDQELIDNR